MDLTTLGQLKEIGIALAAVAGFAYITKYTIDKNKEVFDALTAQLKNNQDNYTSFVQTNNHGNTERIEKSTAAMVEVASAIKESTKTQEIHNKALERLIDKIG